MIETSRHLPECPAPAGLIAPVPKGCICSALRACEQRVRKDERLAAVEWIVDGFNKGWHVGYEVGTKATDAYGVMRDHWLDAAREAVVTVDHYRVMECDPGLEKGRYDDPDPFLAGYLIYADDALAAIDALREKRAGNPDVPPSAENEAIDALREDK